MKLIIHADYLESFNGEKIYYVKVGESEDLDKEDFYRVEGVKRVKVSDDKIEITTISGVENLDKLVSVILNQGATVESISTSGVNPRSLLIQIDIDMS